MLVPRLGEQIARLASKKCSHCSAKCSGHLGAHLCEISERDTLVVHDSDDEKSFGWTLKAMLLSLKGYRKKGHQKEKTSASLGKERGIRVESRRLLTLLRPVCLLEG